MTGRDQHVSALVAHALGFLAVAYDRQGLSEEELLSALSSDDETWAEFVAARQVGKRRCGSRQPSCGRDSI